MSHGPLMHPTHVLPTEAEVADAIEKSDWPTDGRATRLDHPNAYLDKRQRRRIIRRAARRMEADR